MLRFIQCCVAILVCECQCGITDDWYRWRGPKLNGTSSETDWNPQALLPDPRISWTVEVGIGFSSVVVQGNVAFTMGHVDIHDIVYCLNVADGTTKWKYAYSAALDDRDFEGGTTSTPTIDDERLYVLSRTGELFCLNVNNGNVIWSRSRAGTS